MTRSEESRIIARARRGQADAFRALVDEHKDRLFGFVWRMIRDHHEAEDLCQAAFIKAYESLESYSEQYAFSTWLFTIAYRLCLNRLRKRRELTTDPDFARIDSGDSDAAASLASSEEARRLKELIWEAVDKLAPAQKGVVLLFYREEKSCAEIGQVLGIPAVTVKSHLHRARARLRELLGAELVADWRAIEFLSDSRIA